MTPPARCIARRRFASSASRAALTAALVAGPSTAARIADASPPQDIEGVERGSRTPPAAEPAAPQPRPDDFLARERLLGDLWGLRGDLEAAGLIFNATLIYELLWVADGGVRQQSAGRTYLGVVALADLDRLAGLQGAKALADVRRKEGPNTVDDAGSFVPPSNIDAPDFAALYELWFEQTLFDGALRLKVGKVDVNTEFAFAEHAAEFIHSNFGAQSTLYGAPSYPNPAASINLFAYSTAGFYAGAGFYDGSVARGVNTGFRGPSTFFNNDGDFFVIGEAGATWGSAQVLPGRLAVGAHATTATVDRFDGGTQRGVVGQYLALDQALYRVDLGSKSETRGVSAFLLLGFADPDASAVRARASAGVVAQGVLPGRRRDSLGFGISWDRFTGKDPTQFQAGDETSLEWFYSAAITPCFTLKPVVQWIFNPGGGGAPDALIAGFRAEISF